MNNETEPSQEMREILIPAADNHYGNGLRLVVPWRCIHCGGERSEPIRAYPRARHLVPC